MNETVLAVIAIGSAVLSAASIILHVVAPRTKATWDDKLRDDLDEVLGLVRLLRPTVAPQPSGLAIMPTGQRDPQAGRTEGALLAIQAALAVLTCATVLAMAVLPACATVKRDAAAAKVAIVECAKQDAGPILQLLGKIAAQALTSQINGQVIDWPAIEGSALVRGKIVGGCALTRFVAELAAAPKAEVAARGLLAPPDPVADGRALLAKWSKEEGGMTWSVQ
jgi:hypothetical protein